jgi:hypothetical protein
MSNIQKTEQEENVKQFIEENKISQINMIPHNGKVYVNYEYCRDMIKHYKQIIESMQTQKNKVDPLYLFTGDGAEYCKQLWKEHDERISKM